jgi:SAM-dependent methyltransferase
VDGPKARWVAVFDRAAVDYDRGEPRFFADVARRLVRQVRVAAGERVLDVSTGPGVVLLEAAEVMGASGSLTGVDLSLPMALEARRRLRVAGVRAAVVRSDAERLGLRDASFDVALSSNGWFAPSELLRVLRPGGRAGVALFGEADARWAWKDDLLLRMGPRLDALDIGRPSTPAELADRLAAAGFADVTVSCERLDVPFRDMSDWWRSSLGHGERRALEGFSAAQRHAFLVEADLLAGACREADGRLHWRPEAMFGLGRRPD